MFPFYEEYLLSYQAMQACGDRLLITRRYWLETSLVRKSNQAFTGKCKGRPFNSYVTRA